MSSWLVTDRKRWGLSMQRSYYWIGHKVGLWWVVPIVSCFHLFSIQLISISFIVHSGILFHLPFFTRKVCSLFHPNCFCSWLWQLVLCWVWCKPTWKCCRPIFPCFCFLSTIFLTGTIEPSQNINYQPIFSHSHQPAGNCLKLKLCNYLSFEAHSTECFLHIPL